MLGELKDKLKLRETLNKFLKNNGIVDIEVLEGVVNELKTKLNTLINDFLGVEHSIDNKHLLHQDSSRSKMQNFGT
jgi:regulator of PEP synthase PpsR (kinase-PPPase family)